MKRSSVLVGIASLIILAASSMSYAQGRGMGAGFGACPAAAVWGQLSADQQKQMTALQVGFLKKIEGLRSQIAQKRIEMLDLASKDKPDEQAIEKTRQQIWGLQDSMRNARRALGTKIRTVLTAEQLQKLGPFGMRMGGLGFGKGCPMSRGFGGGRCGGWCGMGMSSF
jgi:Spy/CpxP family protein refolding chaperone